MALNTTISLLEPTPETQKPKERPVEFEAQPEEAPAPFAGKPREELTLEKKEIQRVLEEGRLLNGVFVWRGLKGEELSSFL